MNDRSYAPLFEFAQATWGLRCKSNTIYIASKTRSWSAMILDGCLSLRSANDYLDARARLRLKAGFLGKGWEFLMDLSGLK